jgi:hypothetical protein
MSTTLWPGIIDEDGALVPTRVFEQARKGSAVQPHTRYQTRPIDWIVDVLGIERRTLVWSLCKGYKAHLWDGTPDPLVAIANGLARGEDVGVESGTGTGKAQPLTEPVLTPTGWRPIGSLAVGDDVIGSQGVATKVTGVFPQGRRVVYRVSFSDGASTLACAEHLWAVQSKSAAHREHPNVVVSTMQLADMIARSPTSSYRVPIPGAVEFAPLETPLPIEPYVMGVILGDGGLRGNSPTLASVDEEILAGVAAGAPAGIRVRRRGISNNYGLTTDRSGGTVQNPLTASLAEMGLMGKKSEHKHVPPDYLISSPADRLALLQGLMDTDGCVAKGHAEFSSTSLALAEGVQELARSLGGTASIRERESWLYDVRHLNSYRVTVRLPAHLNPFRLTRKAKRVNVRRPPVRVVRSVVAETEAECICIRVEALDRLYVTKDYIVTHNSYLAACLILWFLACWKGARVFTYAPKEDQLRLFIWAEIATLWPRFQRAFPTAELSDLRIRMDGTDKWSAQGMAVGVRAGEESATKAQGAHAPHMLIVTEETPGIPKPTMTALRNTRTGMHNPMLALGNPDEQQDALHTYCTLEDTTHVIVSALDHPNVVTGMDVVPGAASLPGIRRIAAEDPPGTPMYDSRVRGISPAESTDSLIKLAWVKAAVLRRPALLARGGQRALGVDVANSESGDKASRTYWLGAAVEQIKTHPCPNANKLGAEVAAEASELSIAPEHIGVDPVGVGAGTVNELDRLGMTVRRLGGSMSPVEGAARAPDGSSMDFVPDANRFNNLRSQMAWQLREDLRNGEIGLPDNQSLHRQLTSVRFDVRGGKIVVEEKIHVKARLGASPNDFDSVMYGNWVRPRVAKTEETDSGDDRHPGYDYKAKKVKRRHVPVAVPGGMVGEEDDDLRPNRYRVPRTAAFRMPRPQDEEEDE